jgi:hypothetical protein
MSKLTFRAQTVDIACLPLRQDLLAKSVLMTAQRDLGLGNSLFILDIVVGFLRKSPSACKRCCCKKVAISGGLVVLQESILPVE